ncbi:uncharacterized protein BX663DRAFT_494082 [Cokeromyces recurvatus]|uniref:uncharacterized protein n=1 Tax=Cokeromyces recurvatus TaxID=90255 RepID=UPI00221EBC0E|nr:uncharacterized protein BX663DRAFT_494082 [Cokeromyces recurvatus]KAI7906883.1 hypothetical protein BX663DRAFT_494082 [Cokeromyces recurvatus]
MEYMTTSVRTNHTWPLNEDYISLSSDVEITNNLAINHPSTKEITRPFLINGDITQKVVSKGTSLQPIAQNDASFSSSRHNMIPEAKEIFVIDDSDGAEGSSVDSYHTANSSPLWAIDELYQHKVQYLKNTSELKFRKSNRLSKWVGELCDFFLLPQLKKSTQSNDMSHYTLSSSSSRGTSLDNPIVIDDDDDDVVVEQPRCSNSRQVNDTRRDNIRYYDNNIRYYRRYEPDYYPRDHDYRQRPHYSKRRRYFDYSPYRVSSRRRPSKSPVRRYER